MKPKHGAELDIFCFPQARPWRANASPKKPSDCAATFGEATSGA